MIVWPADWLCDRSIRYFFAILSIVFSIARWSTLRYMKSMASAGKKLNLTGPSLPWSKLSSRSRPPSFWGLPRQISEPLSNVMIPLSIKIVTKRALRNLETALGCSLYSMLHLHKLYISPTRLLLEVFHSFCSILLIHREPYQKTFHKHSSINYAKRIIVIPWFWTVMTARSLIYSFNSLVFLLTMLCLFIH